MKWLIKLCNRRAFAVGVLALSITGCESNPVGDSVRSAGNAVANSLSLATTSLSPGAMLIIKRRLYLSERPDDTYVQRGYPVSRNKVDVYDPWCRFVVNLEIAGETAGANITRIEPDRFRVLRMSTFRTTSMIVPPLHNQPVMVASTALTTWVTRFKLESEKHPWVIALECGIFGSDDRSLGIDDARKVLAPSAELENPQ